MSRYKSCEWKPIRGTTTRRVVKDLMCWHTAVGTGWGTWGYFDRLDIGVYSHGIICGKWGADGIRGLDGHAFQMADTDYQAAANLNGNGRVISWETADNAVRPIQPWTPKMCEKIIQIMVEGYFLDGIPLVLVPDSKPGRRGHCYHRQGCDPYRVAGGELWSAAYGKDCPTDPRIAQIADLLAEARRRVSAIEHPPKPIPAPVPDQEDNDMLQLFTEIGNPAYYTYHPAVGFQHVAPHTPFSGMEVLSALKVSGLIESTTPVQLNSAQFAMLRAHARMEPYGGLASVTDAELEGALGGLVSEAELNAALTRVMADQPDADLSDETIQRIAQSVASLVSGGVSPDDPTGI